MDIIKVILLAIAGVFVGNSFVSYGFESLISFLIGITFIGIVLIRDVRAGKCC